MRVDPAALDQGGEWEIRRVSQARRTWNSWGGEGASQVPESVVEVERDELGERFELDHGCRMAKAKEANERRKRGQRKAGTGWTPNTTLSAATPDISIKLRAERN